MSMCSSVDPLNAFLLLVPFNNRKQITSIILRIRNEFKEHIQSSIPITSFVRHVNDIRNIFTHTTITLRTALKTKLLDAINQCLESAETVAVFVLILSIIELGSIRNADRCDLETASIRKSFVEVNAIVSNLSTQFESKRSNLLSLFSWAIGTLVFTYRSCLIWCARQDCVNFKLSPMNAIIPIDPNIASSPSLPKVLEIVIRCQANGVAPPMTKKGYSLFDLIYASAISNGTQHMISEITSQNRSLDSDFDLICASKIPLELERFDNEISTIQFPFDHAVYASGNTDLICSSIKLIERKLLDNTTLTEEVKHLYKETMLASPSILIALAQELDTSGDIDTASDLVYSSVFCGLLKLWTYALDKRFIFKDIPQSYLYLTGFVNARYQEMPLKNFTQAIILQSQFLTSYLSVFRSNILASPHWYLQMLGDMVISIIDRLQSASNESDLAGIEMAICPCIAAISRSWSSLRADEPNFRPEVSRAVKGLLNSIIVRIATTSFSESSRKRKWGSTVIEVQNNASSEAFNERAVLSPRVRQMLNTGILFPLLQVIDVWALQQSKIGLKPVTAAEVLRKLVSISGRNEEDFRQGSQSVPMAHAAVGGLSTLKAKANQKRQRH